MWAVAALVLAHFVVAAQPTASLAWLGGSHVTLEQAALHEAAVERGHVHHHGVAGHHEHPSAQENDRADDRSYRATLGPEFASAAPHAGLAQDLFQTLPRATLEAPPDVPPSGDRPRRLAPAEDVPSQHSPTVPHRPPIPLPPTPAMFV